MKFILALGLMLLPMGAIADHRHLDDAVQAISSQLGTVHYLVEAKAASAHGHEQRDLQRIAESAHHLQQVLVRAVSNFRRTGDRDELLYDFEHAEHDFEKLVADLEHGRSHVFDAVVIVMEDLWRYAALAASQGEGNQPTASCQIHHSSAIFPSTTVSCQSVTGNVTSWRLTWTNQYGSRSASGRVTQDPGGTGSFSERVGRIGGRSNSYKLELITTGNQAYEVRFTED